MNLTVKKITTYIIHAVLCLFVHPCFGDYFPEEGNRFQKLTIESGLSQNKVNCILRDKTGYVWIGTGNGLNRFDGKNVRLIEKDFRNEYQFRDLEIFDLYEDRAGVIWIATEKGLFNFDSEFDKMSLCKLSDRMSAEPSIQCVVPDCDSLLWLGTNDGLKLFDKKAGTIVKEYGNIPYEPYTLSNDLVLTVCCHNEDVWVGTIDGLNKLDRKKGTFKRYFHNVNNNRTVGSNSIQTITEDDQRTMWIGSEYGGLSMYSDADDNFVNYNVENSPLPHNDIRDIFSLKNGRMWLVTNGGGLVLFDRKTQQFTIEEHDPLNVDGLINNSIYTVYEDHEGILWLGFYAGGVNFRTSAINVFKDITHSPGIDNSICEDNVRSLFLDSKQNLWMGTFGGVSFFDKGQKRFHTYLSNSKVAGALSFNKITSFLEDSQHNIWIGTYSGGLNLKKASSTSFKRYQNDKFDSSSLSSDNVYAIYEDTSHRLWVGTAAGLNRYVKETDSWERVLAHDVRDIIPVQGNKLLLGTLGGLIIYNPETGSSEILTSEKLAGSYVVSLLIDSGNKVWISTQGGGFGVFNIEDRQFKLYNTSDGLPSNFIASIQKYGEDHLWLSTYRGLSLFSIKKEQFINFGLAEGLPFLEFYPRSSVKLPDNSLAFGGSKGIVIFQPDKIVDGIAGSKLRFDSFKIDGNLVELGQGSPLKKSIGETKELVLRYSQNDFAFDFVDINYKSRGLGNYSYKLENYMNDWVNIGNQTNIGFTNMDPGKYVLKIRKLGGDLLKGYQDELTMNITIIPPFWMTWYFYLLVLAAVVGLMFLYNKYTLISISQQNKIKLKNLEYEKHEEFNRLRMKFFTYVSHELRTPLSLIVDPLNYLLKLNAHSENYKYLKLIDSSTERLQRLVNQILDFRQLENDTLSLQVCKSNIGAEVQKIFDSFEQTAQNERINYRFDNQIGDTFEGWIDPDKLEKMMYNLLANAFKFTRENGEVNVGLRKNEASDAVLISIEDNGFGLAPEKLQRIFEYFYSDEKYARNYKAGVGIGLNYVKRLVDLHHGTITVESELQKGTKFTITLPILENEYLGHEIAREFKLNGKSQQEKVTQAAGDIHNHKEVVHSSDVPLILVVEDESDLRKYIAARLGDKFRVMVAINGEDALLKMKENIPDLILSDNVMPVMNGVEFCNRLKSSEEYRHIPFIFLSAWNSDDFKMKGLKEGAEDYLSKPFNFDILEAKIINIIEKRRLLLKVVKQIVKVNPGQISIETSDERFMLKAQEVIEKNIENADFNTKDFEDALNMSHSVVYRKIKTLTGLSANEFIREFKIRRAAQIIEQDGNLSVLDVSLMVGFNDQKYFSRCFKKVMGVSPSEYGPGVKQELNLD